MFSLYLCPGAFPGELKLGVAGCFCGVMLRVEENGELSCDQAWQLLAPPGSFLPPPKQLTPRCLKGRLPCRVTQLSNARPEGFQTDNGAALSDVSHGTEGDPRGPRWGEQRHKCLPANRDK